MATRSLPCIPANLVAVFARMDDGILLFEATSRRAIHANAACARLAGLDSAAELVGLSAEEVQARFDFAGAPGEPPIAEVLGRVLDGGEDAGASQVRFRRWKTQERRWGTVSIAPVAELSSDARLASLTLRDVTVQRRAEHSLRLFTEASALLTSTLDFEETMQAVVRLVVPELADGCTLDLLDEDGTFHWATAQLDEERERIARELRRRYPFRLDSPAGPGFVMRTGQPTLVNDITDEMLRRTVADEEHFRLFKQFGLRSAMAVPLKARGRTLGALSLSDSSSGRRFDEESLALAGELASRAALALDNARLYREARAALARKDEEVRLSEALRRLGTSLADELDPRALFQRITLEASALVGARVGAFSHRRGDGAGAEDYAAYAVFGARPDVLPSGCLVPWPADPLAAGPTGERGVRCDDVLAVAGIGPCPPYARSYLAVPVTSRAGEVMGGLFFAHPEPAYFTPRHQRLAQDVAAQAAITLENAQLFQQLREAEASTRRSEERLRLAMDVFEAGYIDRDLTTHELVASPRFESILGLNPGECADGTADVTRRIHPEDRPRVIQELAEVVRSVGSHIVAEGRVVHEGGGIRWIEAHTHAIRDEAGRPMRRLVVVRDITERKAAEARERELALARVAREEAESARSRIAAILDGISEPVLLLGPDRRFRFLNHPAQRLLGGPREELLDTSAWDVPPLREAPALLEHLEEVGRTGTPARFEQRLAEERWYDVGACPMEGGLLVSLHDVTARRRAEESLSRHAEELTRSNTELQQFAYVASHDLQEPLRIVTSYLQLLARRYQGRLGTDADEFIRYAVDAVARMKALINDLLEYSRVGTHGRPLVPVLCDEVLRGVLDTLSLTLDEASAQVTCGPLPEVLGDARQLDQLFRNLIGNALKFRRDEPPRIRVSAEARGDEWVLSVQDNGLGIEPQFFERIFVIFQRLHGRDEYPGTGIGLAICKKIVERHGGRIWVESKLGEGSTFHFTLRRPPG